jgi:hypothetical protein
MDKIEYLKELARLTKKLLPEEKPMLKPTMRRSEERTSIKPEDLPIEALRNISSRQKSFIDEFSFIKLEGGTIEVWYAGEYIATWDGSRWNDAKGLNDLW